MASHWYEFCKVTDLYHFLPVGAQVLQGIF